MSIQLMNISNSNGADLDKTQCHILDFEHFIKVLTAINISNIT